MKHLPTITPFESGIGSKAIFDFIHELEENQIPLHSFLILKDGKLVSEGYYHPFTKEKPHRIYSCSKSFVSAAIGLLESEGKLKLDDKICDYFRDKLPEGGVHPFIARTTIRDMLRMASPHARTTYKLYNMDDWAKTFFICEPSHLPGTVFSYDTSATFTLTSLVERLSGVSLMEYLRPRVFDKIGISDTAYALKSPLGTDHGGSGLIMTTEDMARFALCCMQEGVWEGEQVLPREYIKAATSKQIDNQAAYSDADCIQGYGYQFWVTRNGGFALYGMGGQIALCMPEENLVVVTTADTQSIGDGEQRIYNAVWNNLYPKVKEKQLLDPEVEKKYAALLEQTLLKLCITPVKTALPPSSLAAKLSGKTFRMEKNAMNLKSLRFDFDETGGTMHYENASGIHSLTFGIGAHRAQKFPDYDYDCITSAGWVYENNLFLRSYIIDEYFATLKVSVTFEEDSITVVMRPFAELFLEEYAGFASGTLE